MRVRKFRQDDAHAYAPASAAGRRRAAATALALLLALAAAALPAPSRAQRATDGRPRRVTPAQQQRAAMPAANAGQARATPTPTPTPRATPGQAGAPKLQTQPQVEPQPTPGAEGQQGDEVGEEDVVKVEAQLINLQVRVVDRNNRPIKDVRKEDFRVFDNGVPQTVEFFEQQEVPISYGMVIDNSGSLRNQINQVIEASKTIISSNRPGDETFVVRFVSSDEIKILQDFTPDKAQLVDVLENDLYIEGGQTAVIDAVVLSAGHAAEHKKGNDLDDKRRRALILVTDGEDRSSFYKERDLFEQLREQDVQIYVIGFVNELEKEGGFIRKSKREKAADLLNRLAKETGGRAFFPNSLSELPGIANEITKDLRTQFVIGYNPTNKARPGEFHSVRVTVADASGRDKRIAITRSGYTARGDGATTTAAPPQQKLDQPSPVRRP